MKHAIWLAAALLGVAYVCPGEDCQNSPADNERAPISTKLGYIVIRKQGCKLPKDQWPNFAPPKNCTRRFDEPSQVWTVGEDYFCTVDNGEFGGCLSYGDKRKRLWVPLIDTNINGLMPISESAIVATGGFGHLNTISGYVYLLVRDQAGKWKARRVFESETAVPNILGVCTTRGVGDANGKALVAFSFWDGGIPGLQSFVPGIFGVDSTGVSQFLGSKK